MNLININGRYLNLNNIVRILVTENDRETKERTKRDFQAYFSYIKESYSYYITKEQAKKLELFLEPHIDLRL